MPKERIYGDRRSDPNAFDMSVTWSAANSAHSTAGDGYEGRVFVGVVEQTEDQPMSAAMLDRSSINRLIRALRRARDHAFGSDA